ncbi:MAG TPA: glutaminase A [Stellaceae bacterium]|jgi:glutaminase|nr:glutaminase A [Stellaceae bacterium]
MNASTDSADSELQLILEEIYRSSVDNRDGALADYIPELAKVDPDRFGLAIATAHGHLVIAGDSSASFTIQSVSKAFTYCLAIELVGREAVLERVGVEPSGDAFNAIEFDPYTRRPYNPMVNAGAITVAGIIHDVHGKDAYDFILERFSRAAGRRLALDESVYRSESATGHRNRAIAHLLLSVGALSEPVEPIVDLYFRQCSINVTAIDLAWMGATLANLGTHPRNDDQIFDLRAVRDTQTVMFSCGMYDYSGNWASDVGIPAKSGVGGGVIGVVNRQLGIGSYSPRLDRKGNSVRGLAAFAMLSDELGLHAFDCTNRGSSLVERFMR